MRFILIIVLFLGCAHPQNGEHENLKSLHKLRTAKIKRLIHEINEVMYRQNRSEIERDDEKRRYMLRLADQFKHMSSRMLDILNEDAVSSCLNDRQTFKQYAWQLRKYATSLHVNADGYRFDAAQKALNQSLNLCAQCHENGKINADVLEPYRK